MSLVSDVITRLEAIDEPPFRIVDGAAAFSAVKDKPRALPAAYVFVKEEASSPTERMTGPVLQRVETDLAVLIIAGNVSDARGAAASADIDVLKDAVRAALVGFVPDASNGEPMQHLSGQLVKVTGGTVWFEDLYAAVTYLQEQS